MAKRTFIAGFLRGCSLCQERWRSCRRSGRRKVCMACHWFCDHSGVNCFPALIGQLRHGLTDDMTRQRG